MDLRPVPSSCPIEVVTPEKVVRIGEADAWGMADDDDDADRAIAEAVERGWFALRHETEFDFDFYWDSVREMESFMAGSVRMKSVAPPAAELEKAHRSLAEKGPGGARVRCRRPTMLAVYRKTRS